MKSRSALNTLLLLTVAVAGRTAWASGSCTFNTVTKTVSKAGVLLKPVGSTNLCPNTTDQKPKPSPASVGSSGCVSWIVETSDPDGTGAIFTISPAKLPTTAAACNATELSMTLIADEIFAGSDQFQCVWEYGSCYCGLEMMVPQGQDVRALGNVTTSGKNVAMTVEEFTICGS